MEKGGISTVCELLPKVTARKPNKNFDPLPYLASIFTLVINWIFTCNLLKEPID